MNFIHNNHELFSYFCLSQDVYSYLKMYNAFADKDENRELPGSEWDYTFSEQNGKTKVDITIYNESFERLEKLLEGFKIGFTMTLKNLEELLATLS